MQIEQSSGEIKKRKSSKIIIVLVIAILLVVCGVTIASELVAKVAPDKYVALSIIETQKALQKQKGESPILKANNQVTSMDVNVKEINGADHYPYIDILEGVGLSVDFAKNQDEEIFINTIFKQQGTHLARVNLYSSNNELGLQIPGIFDQYIIVNLDQFKQQYDQSILNYYGGDIEQEEVDQIKNGIQQIRRWILGNTRSGGYADLKERYKEVVMDIAKDIDVQYTGNKKIDVVGNRKKCKTFSITIGRSEVKTLVKGMIKESFKNKDVKQSLQTLFVMTGEYYTIDEWEQEIIEGLDQIRFSDIEVVCAIDNKKHIVSTEVNTAIQVDDEKVKIQANYAAGGKNNLLDTIQSDIKLKADNEQITMSFEKNKQYTKNNTKVTDDVTFRIRENKNQLLRMNYSIEHDRKAAEDNYSLTANMNVQDEFQVQCKLMGNLITNNKDKEVRLEANKVILDIGDSIEQIQLVGSGAFGIKDLAQDVTSISTSEKIDLFSFNEQQLFEVGAKIEQQLYQLEDVLYMFY